MKKPSKEKVIIAIQFGIVLNMTTFGFLFIYLLIWFGCGLPQEWWGLVIPAVLALLSTAGLFQWIYRS